MKSDKIKSLVEQLKNMKKHPNVWSVDFSETQSTKENYMNNEIERREKKEIWIWAHKFKTSGEIYKFADWVRYCLNIEEMDKTVYDKILYKTTIDDFKLTVCAEIIKENRLDVLSTVAGCTLVKKTQTFQTESYVCENKASL